MKYVSTKVAETVLLNATEMKMLETFIDATMYRNDDLKVNISLQKDSDDHWKIVNFVEDSGLETVVNIAITPREGEGSELALDYSKVEFDITTGQLLREDWGGLFQSIINRCILYATAQNSASTIVEATAKPFASLDLLGKSYIAYHEIHEFPQNGKKVQIPGEPFVKLASSVKIDEKIIDTIPAIRKSKLWIRFGCRNDGKGNVGVERGNRLIKEEDFEKEFKIRVSDTVDVWNLIEARKLYPVYQMGKDINESIQASAKIIENILAENEINPNFSKSKIILA